MLLYFLECAKSAACDVEPVEFICEIVSKERTKVRALSGDSYQSNQALSQKAIKVSVESIKLTGEWAGALKSDYPDAECAKLMRAWFQWPSADGDDDGEGGGKSGNELVKHLAEKAEARHDQHVGKIHSAWAKSIGLSSRRLSRRMRYAPNDRLLKTIVVTLVKDRMQFDKFLHVLKERYGLVIGDAEGARLVLDKKVDQEALSENQSNLESRLVGLGLLLKLSDSCSFVENPFGTRGEE